jgi:hypothetical protein
VKLVVEPLNAFWNNDLLDFGGLEALIHVELWLCGELLNED